MPLMLVLGRSFLLRLLVFSNHCLFHFSKFPQLMYAVQCGEFNDIVAWSNDGRSFCINDTDAFEKAVFPVVFKPSKWESFARKLARWGFTRIRLTGAYAERGAGYNHPQFRRGDFALSSLMSCSGTSSNDDRSNDDRSYSEEQQVVSILASLSSTSREQSNMPQKVSVESDAECFIQRPMAVREGNELVASILNLRQQTRKQEHAAAPTFFHRLRRDPPEDDVGMTQHPFQRTLLSDSTKRIPFPSRLPMNYFSPAPPASFAGGPVRERQQQETSNTRCLSPALPGLQSRAMMQTLMQRHQLIKKRKMAFDFLVETSQPRRPRYIRRLSEQDGRHKVSVRKMDDNRFDIMRNKDQILREARAVLDRAHMGRRR